MAVPTSLPNKISPDSLIYNSLDTFHIYLSKANYDRTTQYLIFLPFHDAPITWILGGEELILKNLRGKCWEYSYTSGEYPVVSALLVTYQSFTDLLISLFYQ